MRRRVLIVDDDDVYLEGMKELLESAGYEAITAASFAAGKQAIRDRDPHLLILDVRLGPYNGFQFISTGENKIRAILVTGFDDPVLRADAATFGARFLLKPVDTTALLSLIREELDLVPVSR